MADLNERLQALEEYAATASPDPGVISEDDPDFQRCRLHLARQRDLDPGRKWDTPSERKKRARQLLTLKATAKKLDVQRQAHWQKVHEVYAKAAALEEVCAEDAEEAKDAAQLEEDEHKIRLEAAMAAEQAREEASKRLAALKSSRKRPRWVGGGDSSTEVMSEDGDAFAGL